MKQQVLSAALALCLCISAAPKVYAWQEAPPQQEPFLLGRSAVEPTPYEETASNLTEREAYDKMIALKAKYPEGTPWTNSTPYDMSKSYNWKGGSGIGVSGGVGCAAFAFLLSDEAFGSLPAAMRTTFQFSDVHVGDILRLNGGAHTVIVLQVSESGVVIAEGNYNKTVHWGRTLTKAEVEGAAALITRYPGGKPLEDGSSPNDPVDSNATGAVAGGLTWKLAKSGTLTISGTGAMPDYTGGDQPWSAYLDKILNIVIETGTTHIGNNAFKDSKAMSVTIPESVTEIGDNAFRACTELHSIVLPASIENVGTGAFMSTGLTNATFAPSTKEVTMGDGIFAQCEKLLSVSLPQNMTSIGDGMFSSCWRLSSLYIPKSVTAIGVTAFTSCDALTDIYFGGSEAEWNALLTPYIRPTLQGKNIHYNETLPSPFDKDDPFISDGTGEDPGHTHTWDSGAVTKEASCTEEGTRTYTCTVSGCTETKTETISALGHDYGAWQTVTQATTATSGLKERFCKRCNDRQTQSIPPIDKPVHTHSYGSPVVTKAATCTEPGVRTLTCSCGRTRTEEIPALGHNYGAFVVTKAATCTEPGEQTSACSNCGDTQTEIIPAAGHDYGAFTETKAATCTEPGEQTSVCSNCGDTRTETIPAAGHDYGAFTETKAATCTEPGEQTSVCSNCGDTRTETIPAAGHSYDLVTVIQEASCIENGQQTVACSRCGDNWTETVPAKGHNLVLDADGYYMCSNELNADGNSTMVVPTIVGEGYAEVKLQDRLVADYAYQNEASAQRCVSDVVRKALASVSDLLQFSISTVRYTPPAQTVDGEYVYRVTIRFDGRAAGNTLTTEPLYLIIPANGEPDPDPEPDPIPDVDGEETYYISIPKGTGGEVIPSVRHAAQGERVSLSVHPDTGYELSELTVSNVRGRDISLRDAGNGRYSFTMPGGRVEVNAVFTVAASESEQAANAAQDEIFTGLGTPGISGIVLNPSPMTFTDVPASMWYYNSVDYVWKHYLMSGVSDTQFAPDQTTSRAMIWTILARMHNVRTDINPGSVWYERGMLWALEQGITDGSNPMDEITREQLAVMLWRNVGSTDGGTGLDGFSDADDISGYAVRAVQWAVGHGILQGSSGRLNPKGTATRAEVAAMVMRYSSTV